MTVLDVMAKSPAVCTPSSTIADVAKMMLAHDCGAVPVVESTDTPKPVGIITDRDIVIRLLAEGRDPMNATARDAMSAGVATVASDMSLEAVGQIMETNQVRRVPVVDAAGKVIGIVSQADLALNVSPKDAGEVLQSVSEEDTPNDAKDPMGGSYSG